MFILLSETYGMMRIHSDGLKSVVTLRPSLWDCRGRDEIGGNRERSVKGQTSVNK